MLLEEMRRGYFICDKKFYAGGLILFCLQLAEIWKYLSLPTAAIKSVRAQCESILEKKLGVYRTPSVLPIFYRNELILREKGLLYIEKKGDFLSKVPSSGAEGSRTPVQT
jgi:hypothetical protein